MALVWWIDTLGDYTGDEYDFAYNFITYVYEKNFFYEFVSGDLQPVKDTLWAQSTSDQQIDHLSNQVATRAAAATGADDDAKWLSFKNSFSVNFQPAIQVIIDKERIGTVPATSFATFAARSATTHATNILALQDAPYDFWTPYLSYFRNKSAVYDTGWGTWINSVADPDYEVVIAELADAIAQGYLLGYDNFNVFKTIASDSIADTFTAVGGISLGPLFSLPIYISDQIKNNLTTVFSGYYATEDDKRLAFLQLFRTELQGAIQNYIDTLISTGYISSFSDLNNIPSTTFISSNKTGVATSVTPQITQITAFQKREITDEVSSYQKSYEAGDVFVLDINRTAKISLTYTSGDIATQIATLINDATTGDWPQVTASASGGVVTVTANSNDWPFQINPINIDATIAGFIISILSNPYNQPAEIGSKHPLYLALAQMILNDAQTINSMGLKVSKTLTGTVYYLQDTGSRTLASDVLVTVSDVDDAANPIEIGTFQTSKEGAFQFTYTLNNSFVLSKALKLEAKDEAGNVLLISTDLDSNLFVDAADGTFEGGTAPDYTEWNLTKGTDIKVEAPESVGDEMIPNWKFTQEYGDWFSDYPQTTLALNINYNINGGYFAISSDIYTGNVLTVGVKYRLRFLLDTASTSSFSIKDTGSTAIFNVDHPFSSDPYTVDFVATTPAIKLEAGFGDIVTLYEFSIKPITIGENVYEGDFSPQFYLDATTPTDDFIFKGNSSITVTTNTDYELEAYVYFNDALMAANAAWGGGIYLRPVALGFSDLTEATVYNGDQLLQYESNQISKNDSVAKGQWVRIYSKFNSGVATSITVGLYLKGTLSTDFQPNFAFIIDAVKVLKGVSEERDLSIQVADNLPKLSVYALPVASAVLTTGIAQPAASGTAQISNIFPYNVHTGDVYIVDINHQGSVSFQATDDTVANVTAGLTAAIIANTASVQVTVNVAPDSTHAQQDEITIIDQIHVGAVYTLTLNGGSPVSFTAATTSASDVVNGLLNAITQQEAAATIVVTQKADFSTFHTVSITPTVAYANSKFTLQINGKDTVEIVVVSDAVAELITAINSATGEWEKVTASSGGGGTYVVLTAVQPDTYFEVVQQGGGWSTITSSVSGSSLYITATANNTPFTVVQTGGAFRKVTAADHTTYLSVTALDNNVPFDLYVSVNANEDTSLPVSDVLNYFDLVLPAAASAAINESGISNMKDYITKGGSASLDGVLKITTTQKPSISLPQIVKIIPTKITKGDVFGVQINGQGTAFYVAQDGTVADVVAGLTASINALDTEGWELVTATAVSSSYINVTANDVNTQFTLIQFMLRKEQSVAKMDAIASLYTIAGDLEITDAQSLAVIKELIEAGFQSALDIVNVKREDLVSTINTIIGDFNAARLYEVALTRKALTQQWIDHYISDPIINKTGTNTSTLNQLGSMIKETCSCDDCETAVSPLAYLTDLTNYVLKSITVKKSPQSSPQALDVNSLSNLFFQDFEELPASCEDVINLVCQLRVAVEVMRRYLRSHYPDKDARVALNADMDNYVRDLYYSFLTAAGTSYDEIRMITSDTDKKNLALRLGISYDENPNFLDKLLIPPYLIVTDSWDTYIKLNNPELTTLLTNLSTSLAGLSPSIDFTAFKDLTPEDLRDKLRGLSDSDTFLVELANLFINTGISVWDEVSALNLPSSLIEEQMWNSYVYELTKKFSESFRVVFETFVGAYRYRYADYTGNLFYWIKDSQTSNMINAFKIFSGEDSINNDSRLFDFWLPLAGALLSKVEDFATSEADIEELFGMQDSERDVYSDGAKRNDDTNMLHRWNIRGIKWNINTDAEGYVYLQMSEEDGTIELYRDASKDGAYQVGIATIDADTGKYIISQVNDSGLTGELVVSGLDGTASIYISLVPLLLSWKLNGLRSLWLTTDSFSLSPVVDPDLIGTADIFYPFDINTTTPTKPVDFWQKRKDLLETHYTTLQSAREAANVPVDPFSSVSGGGSLNGPNGIAIASDGTVYISDTGNNVIRKIAGGTLESYTATGLSSPQQLLVTDDNNIIVVDAGNYAVKQFGPSGGSEQWSFGNSGTSLSQFTSPVGITLGRKNDLFVSDGVSVAGNPNPGRIQRFNLPYQFMQYKQVALLDIVEQTAPATGVYQITTVTPSRLAVGDTLVLELEGVGQISYTTTSDSPADAVNGLLNAIAMETLNPWTTVTVESKGIYLQLTATSPNTAFSLSYDPLIAFKISTALSIVVQTPPSTGVSQVTRISSSSVCQGDVVSLTLNGTDSVFYTTLSDSIEELFTGLYNEIQSHSWTSVTASNHGTYIDLTAVATDTAFTLTDSIIPQDGIGYMTVDTGGNRYVSDVLHGRIIKLDENDNLIKVFGTAHDFNRGIQLQLRFDETTGSTARDSAGTGTFNGAINGTTEWVVLSNGIAALSLKTSAYVSISSSLSLDQVNEKKRSLELWFMITDKSSSNPQVLYKQGDGTQGMNIFVRNNELYVGSFGTSPSAWQNFIRTNRIQDGVAHQVVVVFNDTPADGNNVFRAFLDGIEFFTESEGSEGEAIEVSASPDGLFIGGMPSGSTLFEDGVSSSTGYYFVGKVYDCRIWNRALEDKEINLLFHRAEDSDGYIFRPGVLTLDNFGNLFVADNSTCQVIKFDASGSFVSKIGSGYGSGVGEMQSIAGLAVDTSNNTVYVSDNSLNTVIKFNDLGFLSEITSTTFSAPLGMTVNQHGILYVADSANSRVLQFDNSGSLIKTMTSFVETTSISFSLPTAVCIDSENNLVVFDEGLDKLILMNDKSDTLYSLHGGPWDFSLFSHASVAADGNDYIYLGVSSGQTRVRFPQQISNLISSDDTNTVIYFNVPSGMTTDADGNLWIADKSNHRVIQMTPDGVCLNIIGNSDSSSGTGNGQFSSPEYVTLDESDNLYVSDTGNNRIQKFDRTGVYLGQWTSTAFPTTQNAPTGIVVDENRKVYVAQRGASKVFLYDSMQGYCGAIQSAFGISLKTFLEISLSEKAGTDITDLLATYSLSYNGYRQLMALIAVGDRNISFSDEQLQDLYNVLVRAYKESLFSGWIQEEQDAKISLSPDLFVLRSLTDEQAVVLTPWRAFGRERRDWVTLLQTRSEQDSATYDENKKMIDDTEEAFLIRLRDLLIMASDFSGTTLDQKADVAGNQLLIDFKNTTCQRTTRVSQAIEVLQNLVWGLKNGLITDTLPNLTLNKTDNVFDEEWKWMGSYATWKAAQFVFVYPENLLLPSYNTKQSGGFKTLTDNISMNTLLTEENLEDYISDYYDYIRDINSLQFLDAVEAADPFNSDPLQIGVQPNLYNYTIYMIARGSVTKNLYWSKTDVSSTFDQAAFWNRIELDNAASYSVVRFVNLQYSNKDERDLFLFLLDNSQDKPKLVYIKYDLEAQQWSSGDPKEVDMPDFDDGYGNTSGAFNGVYLNRPSSTNSIPDNWRHAISYTNEQKICVHRGKRQLYYSFNDDLTSLIPIPSSDNLYILGTLNGDKKVNIPTDKVFGFSSHMVLYQASYVITKDITVPFLGQSIKIGTTSETKTSIFLSSNLISAIITELVFETNDMIPETLFGEATVPIDLGSYGYTVNLWFYKNANGEPYYIISNNGIPIRTKSYSNNKINVTAIPLTGVLASARYISNMFYDPFTNTICVIAHFFDGIKVVSLTLTSAGSPLLSYGLITGQTVVNTVSVNFNINQFPQPHIANSSYAAATQTVYTKANTLNNPYYKRYVEELYYSVPLTAGIVMQNRGAYENALEWFKLVYDYSKPSSVERKVWYGLIADSQTDYYIDKGTPTPLLSRTVINNQNKDNLKVVSNTQDGLTLGRNVLAYKATYLTNSGIAYAMPSSFDINLDDPEFSVWICDSNFTAPTDVTIVLGALGNANYAKFTARLNGTGWQKLNFSILSKGAMSISGVSYIRLQIPVSMANDGKVFYIADFAYGNTKSAEAGISKPSDWLSDPINPHYIASTRPGTYEKYTIMAIVACLIEYANSEYTKDTVESVPRARLLYENALELLKDKGIGGTQELCREEVDAFELTFSSDWQPVWERLKLGLYDVKDKGALELLFADINAVIDDSSVVGDSDKLKVISNLIHAATDNEELFRQISGGLQTNAQLVNNLYLSLHSDSGIYNQYRTNSSNVLNSFKTTLIKLTGVEESVLLSDKVFAEDTVMAQLHQVDNAISNGNITLDMITGAADDLNDLFVSQGVDNQIIQFQLSDLKRAMSEAVTYNVTYKPDTNLTFCVPTNAYEQALVLTAEINLFKIRSGRNISGEIRELSPFATSISASSGLPSVNGGLAVSFPDSRTFNPSIYRYETLLDRAKQLVQIAQQVESSMLAALEKLDAERYNVLKAKQDLSLANAGIKLQDLRTTEANDNIKLAQLQKDKAQIALDHYTDLIAQGLLPSEEASLGFLLTSIALNTAAAILFEIAGATGSTSFSLFGPIINPGSIIAGLGQALSTLANVSSELSSLSSLNATYERRNQEWNFQKDLASKDVAIGNQQITIAKDQLAVVGQERNIAQLQADNAEATIDFLANKFTNAELYQWMSGVLQKVYQYFLQQATNSAKLAATQLSFERQQVIPDFIKSDYWQAPVDNLLQSGTLPGQQTVDRKGLTGSTRLLQDIYQLDEYAFENDPRRLELTKTISLSALSPAEFQAFRETGELVFELSMTPFDRDFPGHYQRMIRSVKTSIIALTSPVEGIKATLTNTGVSRIVVQNNGSFQKVQLKRTPELVALTSSSNASGLFEMTATGDNTRLLPFEKTGVESQWIFRLPKASNFFDFTTIADVILTIEYTALNSDSYRTQVLKILQDSLFEGTKAFSFKNNFPDQWYDLCNPLDTTSSVIPVAFTTKLTDFPVNLRNIKTTNLVLYVSPSDQLDPGNFVDQITLSYLSDQLSFPGVDQGVSLTYTAKGTTYQAYTVKTVNNTISTKSLSGGAWNSVTNKTPEGTWTLYVPREFVNLCKNGDVSDLLFVVSYAGEASAY